MYFLKFWYNINSNSGFEIFEFSCAATILFYWIFATFIQRLMSNYFVEMIIHLKPSEFYYWQMCQFWVPSDFIMTKIYHPKNKIIQIYLSNWTAFQQFDLLALRNANNRFLMIIKSLTKHFLSQTRRQHEYIKMYWE